MVGRDIQRTSNRGRRMEYDPVPHVCLEAVAKWETVRR